MGITYNTSMVRDGLVLHLDAANPKSYPGSGTTWKDLSGNGNDGTLVNGVGYSSDNQGSMVFDGVDDWVSTNLGSIVDYLFAGPDSDWTVQTWFKPTGNDGVICGSAGGIGGSTTFAIYMSGDDLRCRIRGTSSSNNIESSISTSQFSCATITWDGSSVLGRHNDKSDVSIGIGGASNQKLNFGIADSREGTLSNYSRFPGNVSLVIIYNRALSEAEIKQNFNALRGRYGI